MIFTRILNTLALSFNQSSKASTLHHKFGIMGPRPGRPLLSQECPLSQQGEGEAHEPREGPLSSRDRGATRARSCCKLLGYHHVERLERVDRQEVP